MTITRFTRHGRDEVEVPDPIHFVVRPGFVGYAVCPDGQLVPVRRDVIRPSRVEARLDCILAGSKTLDLCPAIQSFTVEDR